MQDEVNEFKDDTARSEIERLVSSGLQIEEFPRADTPELIQQITDRLRTSDRSLPTLLCIAGLTLHPVEHAGMHQACESCMYFAIHREHCELPELNVPVKPDWACRLWRI